ncbi:MAG: hypothetical protein IJ374_09060 [Lachnospiraceae bacterium]|nr:hypothetical protein [Lachnospiraceae bacterium]
MNPLKNELLGALVGLSRASESKELLESSGKAMAMGLAMAFSGHENVSVEDVEHFQDVSLTASDEEVRAMIERLHVEKRLMAPDCAACQYPCGRTADYDMEELYGASEALREAKLRLLTSLGKIAVSAPETLSLETCQFLSDALFLISCTYEPGQLSESLEKAEKILRIH